MVSSFQAGSATRDSASRAAGGIRDSNDNTRTSDQARRAAQSQSYRLQQERAQRQAAQNSMLSQGVNSVSGLFGTGVGDAMTRSLWDRVVGNEKVFNGLDPIGQSVSNRWRPSQSFLAKGLAYAVNPVLGALYGVGSNLVDGRPTTAGLSALGAVPGPLGFLGSAASFGSGLVEDPTDDITFEGQERPATAASLDSDDTRKRKKRKPQSLGARLISDPPQASPIPLEPPPVLFPLARGRWEGNRYIIPPV